jgi:hypothetical protein
MKRGKAARAWILQGIGSGTLRTSRQQSRSAQGMKRRTERGLYRCPAAAYRLVMPDWLMFVLNDPVHTHGGLRFVAGTALGFLVTFFTGRLSVPLVIYLLMNLASFAYYYLGMRSLDSILKMMVLGSGFGGFAFGIGWLLGILLCWIFWQARKRRNLNARNPPGTT